jgi:hypothetical protein
MRRPHLAAARKRNRIRLLKKGPGRQSSRRPRPRAARFVSQPEPAPQESSASIESNHGAAIEITKSAAAEGSAGEPSRCGFGAVRVGALIGRLRLHLQTDRFLAVHRCDTLWEQGCVAAALVLADVVASMREAQLDAPLMQQRTQEPRVPQTLAQGGRGLQGQDPTLKNEGWGTLRDSGPTRKTGTATLALCGAALERGAR